MGEAHLRDDNWTYAIEVSPAIDVLPGKLMLHYLILYYLST